MISVCIATFNGEKYIISQIHSILSQLESTDELIISDDHSSDDTVHLIRQINDSRIRIYFNDEASRGYTRNFENALKHAKGEYIFLSDQDDIWFDDKVELTLKALNQSDFTVSDAMVVDENLKVLIPSHFDQVSVKRGFVTNFLKTRYIGACMAFRRKVLDAALPFPKNNQFCAHDYWIAIVAECYFNVSLIRQPLIYYRRHQTNASSGGLARSNFSLLHRFYKRLYCATFLILHFQKAKSSV